MKEVSVMKKTLSCLLAVFLLFSALSVFAAAAEPCGCGHAPIVFVDGFNASDLIKDPDTDHAAVAFPFPADGIVNMIKDNADAVWDMLDARFDNSTEQPHHHHALLETAPF